MTQSGYFPGYANFPGYGSPGIKTCRNSCRNIWYGNFPGYKNYPGYGTQRHTLYHTTIGLKKYVIKYIN